MGQRAYGKGLCRNQEYYWLILG